MDIQLLLRMKYMFLNTRLNFQAPPSPVKPCTLYETIEDGGDAGRAAVRTIEVGGDEWIYIYNTQKDVSMF